MSPRKLTPARSTVTITVDGETIEAPHGASVAAAILLTGTGRIRDTAIGHEPRAVFCGMGSCYDCVARIDEDATVRTCITEVADGMIIETGAGADRG
jgi:predicted molibdopterin-dependent oxidoreductase YjgC